MTYMSLEHDYDIKSMIFDAVARQRPHLVTNMLSEHNYDSQYLTVDDVAGGQHAS
jgi:hypothetical protein